MATGLAVVTHLVDRRPARSVNSMQRSGLLLQGQPLSSGRRGCSGAWRVSFRRRHEHPALRLRVVVGEFDSEQTPTGLRGAVGPAHLEDSDGPGDYAYLGRLPRPFGRAYGLYTAGIHAPGGQGRPSTLNLKPPQDVGGLLLSFRARGMTVPNLPAFFRLGEVFNS
jgi:hypothetical protein